ncbi:hypothetical protein [Niallia sp. NCCP-28]|uniref:hypothetical protein n=1 Tax=Niallia sp. NCCP-28 TaxID=2934712 RepID=UPI00208BEA0A|nr:hypothetical protein [Niallia sp. NCCP-28]GKU85315.1 hypothetical protein NCCP28_47110 [Niallia sp. NCCP-28]
MEKMDNVYLFTDVNEWINYTSSLQKKMLSPGGFAMLAGVSRSTVNSWIYRDKLINYYKCKHPTGGEYGLIPAEEVRKVEDRIKKIRKK